MAWRYLAQRLTGDGAGEFLDMSLPLSGVGVTETLSGPDRITGTVEPEVMRLKGPDGRPLLDEWSTAIYAEENGLIRAGGILTRSIFAQSRWTLDAMGFCGYANGMPYTGSEFFVEEDPTNIFRHIWEHLQARPGGDIGLQVDGTTSPVRLGTELKQVEFDTQAGPVSFEAGPYKLAWYLTEDLGRNLDQLASETPFDYREEHAWNAAGDIEHHLRIGYPKLGTRRTDLRFVIGENVSAVPTVERDGDEYANEVLSLGAGEGRDMVRGGDARADGRLRRVAVVADKTARSKRAANALARRELAARQGLDEVTDITVRDHPHARVGSWQPGDEVRLQGEMGWVKVDMWVRILSSTISPADLSVARLTVQRSDKERM